MSSNQFLEAVKGRRSYYGLNDKEVVSRERIEEIVATAVAHAPSAMNSQSARVVILFGDKHNELWEITKETLKPIVPAEAFEATKQKLDSFKAGYGTILIYEDQKVVKGLEEKFDLYKANFEPWSLQSSGMLQFIIWTALEAEGLGASLQHYNPLIDDQVAETFDISKDFKLVGQLVFGNPVMNPSEKELGDLSHRLQVRS